MATYLVPMRNVREVLEHIVIIEATNFELVESSWRN